MSDKKLTRIILALLITVLAHNFYIHYEIMQIKQEAKKAIKYARSAEDYARYAAEYSSDAVEHARDAANNAFANNCGYCP